MLVATSICLKDKTRKLRSKDKNIFGSFINIFILQEDVRHGRSHNYDTNSIILIGLKVWHHIFVLIINIRLQFNMYEALRLVRLINFLSSSESWCNGWIRDCTHLQLACTRERAPSMFMQDFWIFI